MESNWILTLIWLAHLIKETEVFYVSNDWVDASIILTSTLKNCRSQK